MRELGEVPEEARELAMSRFRLIQPHLEKNQPLQTVAANGKVPFRTAQRWVSQYRKFGLIALARKTRADIEPYAGPSNLPPDFSGGTVV
jgi:putative transposase